MICSLASFIYHYSGSSCFLKKAIVLESDDLRSLHMVKNLFLRVHDAFLA